MEVKMNKEIQDYKESFFFGLSMRQCFFSLLAVAAATGVYLGLKDLLGTEITGWMSVLAAAPFAGCGFYTALKIFIRHIDLFGFHVQKFIQPETCIQINQDGINPRFPADFPKIADLLICKWCSFGFWYWWGGGQLGIHLVYNIALKGKLI